MNRFGRLFSTVALVLGLSTNASALEGLLPVAGVFATQQRAFLLSLPVGPADSVRFPTGSTLELFEDGQPLGPAHSLHAKIRSEGGGLYSDWLSSAGTRTLYFSTFDNSDPRTNGRKYTWRIQGIDNRLPFSVSARDLVSDGCPELASLGTWKSLIDFGGVGDGVADNWSAFRKAYDYLETHPGSTLFIPPGTFRIAALNSWNADGTNRVNRNLTLTGATRVRILGCGLRSVVSVEGRYDTGKGSCFFPGATADSSCLNPRVEGDYRPLRWGITPLQLWRPTWVEIAGIRWLGNRHLTTRPPGVQNQYGGTAIQTIAGSDVWIHDVAVEGFLEDGLTLGSEGVLVANKEFYRDHFETEDDFRYATIYEVARRFRIERVYSGDNGRNAISVITGQDIRISDSVLANTGSEIGPFAPPGLGLDAEPNEQALTAYAPRTDGSGVRFHADPAQPRSRWTPSGVRRLVLDHVFMVDNRGGGYSGYLRGSIEEVSLRNLAVINRSVPARPLYVGGFGLTRTGPDGATVKPWGTMVSHSYFESEKPLLPSYRSYEGGSLKRTDYSTVVQDSVVLARTRGIESSGSLSAAFGGPIRIVRNTLIHLAERANGYFPYLQGSNVEFTANSTFLPKESFSSASTYQRGPLLGSGVSSSSNRYLTDLAGNGSRYFACDYSYSTPDPWARFLSPDGLSFQPKPTPAPGRFELLGSLRPGCTGSACVPLQLKAVYPPALRATRDGTMIRLLGSGFTRETRVSVFLSANGLAIERPCAVIAPSLSTELQCTLPALAPGRLEIQMSDPSWPRIERLSRSIVVREL